MSDPLNDPWQGRRPVGDGSGQGGQTPGTPDPQPVQPPVQPPVPPVQPPVQPPVPPVRPPAPPQQPPAPGGQGPRAPRNRSLIALGVIAGVLAIALVVVIGLIIGGQFSGRPAADGSASPSTTATPSTEPTTSPEPTTTPAPGQLARPTDCQALYPAGYIQTVENEQRFAFNPDWAKPLTDWIASNDDSLKTMLRGSDRLTCIFVNPNGGSERGVETNVVSVTEAQATAAIDRMKAASYSCSDDHGGTRCVIEWSGAGNDGGEQHFLRDGLWVATRWSNTTLTGYTTTIIETLFPN